MDKELGKECWNPVIIRNRSNEAFALTLKLSTLQEQLETLQRKRNILREEWRIFKSKNKLPIYKKQLIAFEAEFIERSNNFDLIDQPTDKQSEDWAKYAFEWSKKFGDVRIAIEKLEKGRTNVRTMQTITEDRAINKKNIKTTKKNIKKLTEQSEKAESFLKKQKQNKTRIEELKVLIRDLQKIKAEIPTGYKVPDRLKNMVNERDQPEKKLLELDAAVQKQKSILEAARKMIQPDNTDTEIADFQEKITQAKKDAKNRFDEIRKMKTFRLPTQAKKDAKKNPKTNQVPLILTPKPPNWKLQLRF